MMRSFAALLFVAAAFAAKAAEQSPEKARVRAGEHPGFSRIAIDLSPVGVWKIDRGDRTVTINFPQRQLEFDLTEITPQRKASRVLFATTRQTETATELSLGLACDCVLDAYLFGANMLVLDIRDKTAGPRPEHARPNGGTQEEAPHAVEAKPQESEKRAPRAGAAHSGFPEATAESIKKAQARLLEQLTRAAEQGLVAFKAPPADSRAPGEEKIIKRQVPTDHSTRHDAKARNAAAHPPETNLHSNVPSPKLSSIGSAVSTHVDPSDPKPQIAVRSVLDGLSEPKTPPRTPRKDCPPSAWFDGEKWLPEGNWHEEISELRQSLYGEFDNPRHEIASRLAKAYIAAGMGEEAHTLIASLHSRTPELSTLYELASVVRGQPVDPNGELRASARCSDASMLWRAAAGLLDLTTMSNNDFERLRSLLAEMPGAVRGLLAPGIIQRLIATNHLKEANALLLVTERSPSAQSELLKLARAEYHLAEGNAAEAEKILRKLAKSRGPEAFRAMIRLGESIAARRGVPPEDFVFEATLAAFLTRGTELGAQLKVTEAVAKAGINGFSEAIQILARQSRDASSDIATIQKAARYIFTTTQPEEVGEAAYAAAVAEHVDLVGGDPGADQARIDIATKLLEIALPNLALKVVAPPLERGVTDARIVAAAALAELGETERALILLSGLRGDKALKTREKVLERAGDYAAALAVSQLRGEDDAQRRGLLAWRAGAWREAAKLLPDPVLADLAKARAQETSTANLPPEPSLKHSRATLEHAKNSREMVEKALSDG
ncbi:hypothetical protein [Oceanicella actignis]|nr:hypothetical protein [Oceanicella actignis]